MALSYLLGRGGKWKLPWPMATTQMHSCYWDIASRLPIALSGGRSSNCRAWLAQPCPVLGLSGPGPASCDTHHLTPTRPSRCSCGAFTQGSVPALPTPAMAFGFPQDSSAGCSGVSHLREHPPDTLCAVKCLSLSPQPLSCAFIGLNVNCENGALS